MAVELPGCRADLDDDMDSITTADPEEESWLNRQVHWQTLEKCLEARAAQAKVLRGALNSSLRTSQEALWGIGRAPTAAHRPSSGNLHTATQQQVHHLNNLLQPARQLHASFKL